MGAQVVRLRRNPHRHIGASASGTRSNLSPAASGGMGDQLLRLRRTRFWDR